jgi:hypothetical protein
MGRWWSVTQEFPFSIYFISDLSCSWAEDDPVPEDLASDRSMTSAKSLGVLIE